MHNCQEFRERISERIIDREDLSLNADFHNELLICSGCSEFYIQSREMMDALSEVDLSISTSQWNRIESRLHQRIRDEKSVAWISRSPKRLVRKTSMVWTPLLATAAMILIAIGLWRFVPPVEFLTPQEASRAIYVEHTVPLDPVTVDFLQDSELLLSNVLKMAPDDAKYLADAKKVASEQLAEMEQRKEAVADVPPVASVMETYETILRDLRNVDDRSADEDIGDLQKRIQQNGLIANMKAFQPRVTEINFSLR